MEKVNRLIKGNFLNERLNQFDQLTQLISTFMSLPLENRVWPLLRGKRLILMTDDPHLATQARFMAKPLANHISKKTCLKIKGIEIKLMSMPLARADKNRSRQKASAKTAAIIESIAESIDDPELQSTLQKLANRI